MAEKTVGKAAGAAAGISGCPRELPVLFLVVFLRDRKSVV